MLAFNADKGKEARGDHSRIDLEMEIGGAVEAALLVENRRK